MPSEAKKREVLQLLKDYRAYGTPRGGAMPLDGTGAMDMRGLTDKQRLFVAEYMKDLNVTRAARQQDQRLLTNIAVRKERAADLMGELLVGARNAREIDE